MTINSSINSNQLLDTSQVPAFQGLNLTATGKSLGLNVLTTAQFSAQSPRQGAIAFTTDSETPIFFDGMLNQLVATQSWADSNFASLSGSYPNPSWITALAGAKITGNIGGNSGGVTGGYVSSLTGTVNQISFTGATGAITASLPQRIDLNATPVFLALTLSGAASGLNLTNNTVSSGQEISLINFNGLTSTSAPAIYGRLRSDLVSNTNGATTSDMVGSVQEGGILTDYFKLDGSAQVINFLKPLSLTSQLTEINGGTNQTAYVLGDLLYASAANTLSRFAGNTGFVKRFLAQTGTGSASAAPVWSTIDAQDINGRLNLAQGGTNASLTASNGGIFYSTASAGAVLSGTSTAGQMLQSGASSAPSWSTPTYPSASGSAGKILRSDGTNNIYSTATFADTYDASTLLYANGSNAVQGLTTANNGTLVTDGSGVPSISSMLPAAVQSNITQLGALSALGATGVVTTDSSSNLTSVNSVLTFIPVLSDGAGHNFTTSIASGQYYKIGHVYHVIVYIVWTSKGSAVSTDGITVSLPATLGANCSRVSGSVGYQTGIGFVGSQLIYTVSSGQNGVLFFGESNVGVATQALVSSTSSSGQLQFEITFWDN